LLQRICFFAHSNKFDVISHFFGCDHICDEDQTFDQFSNGTPAGLLKHDTRMRHPGGIKRQKVIVKGYQNPTCHCRKCELLPVRDAQSPSILNSENINAATP
jgi:hypothetical protein